MIVLCFCMKAGTVLWLSPAVLGMLQCHPNKRLCMKPIGGPFVVQRSLLKRRHFFFANTEIKFKKKATLIYSTRYVRVE